MARIGKKTTGEQAVQSVDIQQILADLKIPFRIKNHELAKFITSPYFEAYPDEFKADFINLTGGGVPFANVYLRITLTKERREMSMDKPNYQHHLLQSVPAEDLSYYFQNTATRSPAEKMSYAMKNYVFIPITSWKDTCDFVYKKWTLLHGVQPSKNKSIEMEAEPIEAKPKTNRKPKAQPTDENA